MQSDDPERSPGDARPDRATGGRRRADGTGRHHRPGAPDRPRWTTDPAASPEDRPAGPGRSGGRVYAPRTTAGDPAGRADTGPGTEHAGRRPRAAEGRGHDPAPDGAGSRRRTAGTGPAGDATGPRPWDVAPRTRAGEPGPRGHGARTDGTGPPAARPRGAGPPPTHGSESGTGRRPPHARTVEGDADGGRPDTGGHGTSYGAAGSPHRGAAHDAPHDAAHGPGGRPGGGLHASGRSGRHPESPPDDVGAAGPGDDPWSEEPGPDDAGPRGASAPAGRRTATPAGSGRAHRAGPGHDPRSGHGHGHGHGSPTPAGRRVRNLLVALLIPCALATLAGVALLWPGDVPTPDLPPTQQVRGDVTAVAIADCSPGSGDGACTGVTIAMTDGPRAGRDLVQLVPNEPSSPRFAVGDPVTLAWSGGDPDSAGSYQLNDFQRAPALIWLAAAFALAVVLLGRLRGFAALVSLLLTFAILLWFVLPAILSGGPPLAVAVTGACLIMFVVLYLTHGFSARTSCAVLGTLVSLALIGVIGYGFTAAARLTGLDDTTANLIGTLGGAPIDPRGLVLAGLVIGALGALDDVTVTQASAVWELGAANPELGARELFSAGMRIGRDHVASAVNTLVLAYAGAALPLMLLFSVAAGGVTDVLTSQDVATEIVRTLAGSIGLVAAVPVTTGLAALVAARR